jgi:hypothetical protein
MLGREELITVEKALELLFHYAPFKRPCEINIAIENAYGMVVSRVRLFSIPLSGTTTTFKESLASETN